MYDDSMLIRGLSALGIIASDEQLSQLHHYYEMMVETNRVMNLTAITEYEDVCVKHWLDSLCLVKVLPGLVSGDALSVIDIGTGAGFPGVPLKILFPQIRLTLLDSLGKRITFLERVVAECGLKDVTCLHARAEEYSRKAEHREQYDVCVSRAVTRLASLTELCLPYVKVGGRFVPYKSGDCAEEVAEAGFAIATLGGKLEETASFVVPESDLGRKLLVISKKRSTDKKYPRVGGKPMKSPIVSRETLG
ncbi:MAG: 16S rRNA (guanine(527)-N(7))-methyltransferase RsmG [Lachnospiraceae bacterium]|nr:16S rRNA (guanine(527)-N(7))-methyltransferase RsmG [Lachnospiraceae bacterium]